MTLTRRLAELLVETRIEDIPEEALDIARQACLDGIGVMIAGAREPQGIGRITLEYARLLGGTPESSIVTGGFKTSALNAAYANGTLCHALDYDNTWFPLNHPTSPTLPAILALAERDRRSGRDVMVASVLAFEVQGRMRLASAASVPGTAFHKPGVSGLAGAVAAAGKLLGLDVHQYCMAFGIAGSRAGSMSVNTGTMTKSTHCGHAARMGVEAAMLARLGWTAYDDIFDTGKFFELYYGPGHYDIDLFLRDFGRPYRMVDPGVGFKKHPANYYTHRPIDAALDLVRQHSLTPEQIENVEVDFPVFEHLSRPVPRTGLDGKYSVQYATAAALLDGKITIDTFSDERRFAPDIEALLPRVRLNMRADIPLNFDKTYAVVRVRTRDGRTLESRCDRPRGIWGTPLTRAERLAKFRDCVGSTLPEGSVNELIELVEGMAELPDISRIMAIATSAKAPAAPSKGAGS